MEKARVVIGKELGQEERTEQGPNWEPHERSRAMGGGSRREADRAVTPLAAGLQKCPYLVGRPPCGTHHLFPSGANVCWAEASEGKPYRVVSRATQETSCFGGLDGQSGCHRFRRAKAEALPEPRFERPPAGEPRGPEWALPPRRPPRRRHDVGIGSRVMNYLAWAAPLGLTLLLLAMLLR